MSFLSLFFTNTLGGCLLFFCFILFFVGGNDTCSGIPIGQIGSCLAWPVNSFPMSLSPRSTARSTAIMCCAFNLFSLFRFISSRLPCASLQSPWRLNRSKSGILCLSTYLFFECKSSWFRNNVILKKKHFSSRSIFTKERKFHGCPRSEAAKHHSRVLQKWQRSLPLRKSVRKFR